MNRRKTLAICMAFSLILGICQSFAQTAEELLPKGIQLEEVKGELEKAIEVYQTIVTKFSANRPIAAKALLHIGLCYEKLGRQEAQKAYQRIIQEFADQKEVVAEARTRLSSLILLASAVQAEDIVIRKVMDGTGAGFVHGAPSPDGKYLSFVDWSTYPNDIVIKEIGTGEEIRLRNQIDLNYEGDVGTPYDPTWSPDSKKIAYTWENDEAKYIELRVIEIDNPEPDVLIRVNYFKGWVKAEDWSPDGQHILIQLTKNHQDQLGLISIADGSFHLLKKFDDSNPTSAKFSPDGHHIAYDLSNKESDNHDIYILSIDGRREIKLTSHPSHDYLLDWSPTGKKILFASDRTGTTDMWSISFDEETTREDPELVTNNIGSIKPLGCTRNGSFYFSTPGSWYDIYTVTIDPETGKITESPTEVPLPYQGHNRYPAWSPNGKYLAYISERGRPRYRGGSRILCIYSVKTGTFQEFDYQRNISHPRWFPDSQSILVNTDNLSKIDAKTGEITHIIQEKKDEGIYNSSISSDNKYIYYATRNKNWEIHSIKRYDLETEKEKELYRTPDANLTMALSPDGKQLALLSWDKENTRILKILSTMNGSEKVIHKFKLKEFGYISTAWSPDGRYIYFSQRTDSEDKYGLWRIPAAGGTAENLGVKMYLFMNISIHPDGRQITFASFVGKEKPGGVWVMENFLPEEKEDMAFNIRKVWASLDVDNGGAPSPDGRYLSYTDWDNGNLAIYEISTGKKRRLTNHNWDESDEFALSSRWSSDGKQIVYDWYNENNFIELRIIGLDGSKPRILYSNEEVEWTYTCDWSPDGTQILAFFERKDGTDQMVLVSTADGSTRVLKTFDKYRPENMCFSPDGRYILYDFPQKEDSPERDISLLSTDGSREIPLIEHPADDFVLGWAPDGKQILFASDRTGTPGIWVIRVTEGNPKGIPRLVKSSKGPIQPIGLGFTRDGSFYYCHYPNKTDVYITEIDPETGKIMVPPHEAINRFIESNATPDYSPDGKYLAYISRRPPMTMRYTTLPIGNVLCIRSLETGEEHEFKPEINRFGYPRWSPDSRSIMVVNWEDDYEHMGLYRIDAKTGEVKLVVSRIHAHEWCADGKSIFLVRSVRIDDKGFRKIVVRDIESGAETELFRGSWKDVVTISRSPDGQWLAFLGRAKKRTLRVIPANGGEPREIHRFDQGGNRFIPITWTADGKYILMPKFSQPRAGIKWDLWRIPVEGGEPQNFGFEMTSFHQLSAHPDGRHIAFSNQGSSYDVPVVWVMENFLQE